MTPTLTPAELHRAALDRFARAITPEFPGYRLACAEAGTMVRPLIAAGHWHPAVTLLATHCAGDDRRDTSSHYVPPRKRADFDQLRKAAASYANEYADATPETLPREVALLASLIGSDYPSWAMSCDVADSLALVLLTAPAHYAAGVRVLAEHAPDAYPGERASECRHPFADMLGEELDKAAAAYAAQLVDTLRADVIAEQSRTLTVPVGEVYDTAEQAAAACIGDGCGEPVAFVVWNAARNEIREALDDNPAHACTDAEHIAAAVAQRAAWRPPTTPPAESGPAPADDDHDTDGPGEVDEYPCCDQPVGDKVGDCPGTCDHCGFSLCVHAADVVRCDGHPEELEMLPPAMLSAWRMLRETNTPFTYVDDENGDVIRVGSADGAHFTIGSPAENTPGWVVYEHTPTPHRWFKNYFAPRSLYGLARTVGLDADGCLTALLTDADVTHWPVWEPRLSVYVQHVRMPRSGIPGTFTISTGQDVAHVATWDVQWYATSNTDDEPDLILPACGLDLLTELLTGTVDTFDGVRSEELAAALALVQQERLPYRLGLIEGYDPGVIVPLPNWRAHYLVEGVGDRFRLVLFPHDDGAPDVIQAGTFTRPWALFRLRQAIANAAVDPAVVELVKTAQDAHADLKRAAFSGSSDVEWQATDDYVTALEAIVRQFVPGFVTADELADVSEEDADDNEPTARRYAPAFVTSDDH